MFFVAFLKKVARCPWLSYSATCDCQGATQHRVVWLKASKLRGHHFLPCSWDSAGCDLWSLRACSWCAATESVHCELTFRRSDSWRFWHTQACRHGPLGLSTSWMPRNVYFHAPVLRVCIHAPVWNAEAGHGKPWRVNPSVHVSGGDAAVSVQPRQICCCGRQVILWLHVWLLQSKQAGSLSKWKHESF